MRLIQTHHIETNIILLHNLSREDLLREVSSSSCVIIPSVSEGFCFVAVESVAMGVPVISSGKGSLSEVVSGRQLTLKSLDAIGIFESLEKAKNEMWENSALREFSLQESMHNYLKLYHHLIK